MTPYCTPERSGRALRRDSYRFFALSGTSPCPYVEEQTRNRPPPENTLASRPSIALVCTRISRSSSVSSTSWATSCAVPVMVPTRMVSSSAIGFCRRAPLAFRYAWHYTACSFLGKHYTAFVSAPSIDIKKSSQHIVNAKQSSSYRNQDYLTMLGDRVRETRTKRGQSRKLLAVESGVSERYLAQLEAGQGNVSILLLRQIASALELSLTELLAEGHDEAAELALTTQFLKRLPRQKLAAVHSQLVRDYGNARDERMKRIALIGLRGAGKSTLGAKLARVLAASFVELDREIEREAGTSLSEIFLLYGQSGYRRYERRSLERVLERNERAVIATGGSIVSEPGTYELLLSACFTVWLKAEPEEHMARVIAQGDTRPMAGNDQAMEDLRRILDGRAVLYGQADVTVDTAGKTPEQSLSALRKAVAA